MRRKWCGVRRSTWLLLFYVGIYVAYLVIGAWAMWFFEINNENMLRKGTDFSNTHDHTKSYTQSISKIHLYPEEVVAK